MAIRDCVIIIWHPLYSDIVFTYIVLFISIYQCKFIHLVDFVE